ncbi:hypothetical protein [Flagellimonas sp.]|uniref:hypothetical protein n=1 Tax=Flagellimonas sp. TaxID=2058762 RepID=UPI003BAA70C1
MFLNFCSKTDITEARDLYIKVAIEGDDHDSVPNLPLHRPSEMPSKNKFTNFSHAWLHGPDDRDP